MPKAANSTSCSAADLCCIDAGCGRAHLTIGLDRPILRGEACLLLIAALLLLGTASGGSLLGGLLLLLTVLVGPILNNGQHNSCMVKLPQ